MLSFALQSFVLSRVLWFEPDDVPTLTFRVCKANHNGKRPRLRFARLIETIAPFEIAVRVAYEHHGIRLRIKTVEENQCPKGVVCVRRSGQSIDEADNGDIVRYGGCFHFAP